MSTDSSNRKLVRRALKNKYLEYWFAVPAFLVLLALFIFPMLWSLYISFTDLNLTVASQRPNIIWLENYATLLTSSRFWNSVTNTAYYVGFGVGIQFVIGFAMALIMANYTSGWINRMLFTLLLLPMMMAPVIAGYMWRLLLQPTFGPVNYLLGLAGLPQPLWFASSAMSLQSILIADVWQWTPFMILILYTGRLSINEDLYEAARIDGASKWFTFRHVTLPQMKGVVAVALLIRAMDAFKFFDKMYVISQGGPGISSELATYYNYLLGFNSFAMGKATAMSWLLLLFA
ncbi:MAG: carbohydrate ABC transporter permease, partial [Halobacteriaceae archaeon]